MTLVVAWWLIKWGSLLVLAIIARRAYKRRVAVAQQARTARFYAVVEEPWLHEIRKGWQQQ